MGSRSTMLLLSLIMLTACSPEPVFRLSPEQGPSSFYRGTEYITLERDSLFITMAYYRHLDNMFAMDLEVYNKRDTTVRVDPARFGSLSFGSYTDSTFTDYLAYKPAEDPERKLLEIDKRISRHRGSENSANIALWTAAGVAITAAILSGGLVDDGDGYDDGDETHYTYIEYGPGSDEDYEELELERKREIWELDALRITDLYPGEHIRGLVFFKNVKEAAGYKMELNIGDEQFTMFYRQRKIKP